MQSSLSVIQLSPFGAFFNNKVASANPQDRNEALLDLQQSRQQSDGILQPINSNMMLPATNRRVRDSSSLLFMFAFLGFLAYIVWDGMQTKETDVNIVIHGHDSYGNICGRNNRPIRNVEKSGKNFTDRPYTKYTLINSQFERYTMIQPDQSRSGELIYVKEEQLQKHFYDIASSSASKRFQKHPAKPSTVNGATTRGPSSTAPSDGRDDSVRRTIVRDRLIFESSTSSTTLPSSSRIVVPSTHTFNGNRRNKRASLDFEAMQKNRTFLNDLKSRLMYQYPPMYGYSFSTIDPLGSKAKVTGQQQQQQQSAAWVVPGASTNGLERPPNNNINEHRANSKARVSGPESAGLDTNLLGSRASNDQSLEVVASLATGAAAQQRPNMSTSTSLLSRSAASVAASSSTTTMRTLVTFDEPQVGGNDSDKYEHMLVTPTDTNHLIIRQAPSPSSTDIGLRHHEVTNQLLYLTECVQKCPQDHVELIFYRCMPNNWRLSLFPNAINVTRTFIDDILTDVSHCYRELIYTFSLALVLSLALLILLRFLASLIIWSCLLLLVSLFLSMAGYAWTTYYYQILDLNNLMPHDSIYAEKLASSDKWLIGSIFLTFISFATIATVIFMRKRILLVTKLFRESGKAIADMPLLLLQPLLTFAALVGITAAWTVGLICLQSMKVPVVDVSTGFVVFRAETLYKIMKWYHVFAFLWVSHFAIACQHYVIGASVSKWYFSTNRYNLNSPIGASISELILYYLGSVALGSFLVAIFKVVRIITKQIQFLVQRNCMASPGGGGGGNHINGSSIGSMSPVSSGCCGSFSYIWRLFIWFFDNIVMIINRDAYVEIAIHGHSFLDGARRAFKVLATNPLRLLAIKSVSNVLLMIAKVCVVFGTVSVAMLLLEEKNTQLNYSWSPIIISAIYAYIVAHWFLSVYEMVIDALFICYCEDYELSKNREASAHLTGSNFMNQILTNGQIF